MSASRCEYVETPRLICERLRADQLDQLRAHLQDPRVARTTSASGLPPSDAEVRDWLRVKLAHWERLGFGVWLLRDRESGQLAGQGGLQATFITGANEVEAGWSIIPERWGQGLATELAETAAAVAFDQLRLPEIIALTLPDNHASRRVMVKSGFVFECEIRHAGLPHVLYRRRAGPVAPPPTPLLRSSRQPL